MADRLILLDNRFMVLSVFAVGFAIFQPAASIEEKICLIQVFLVAGLPVKLDQPDVDFLVAGRNIHSIRAEYFADEIGVLQGNVENLSLAGSLEVSHCSLVEVARAVELMSPPDIRPALLAAPHRLIGIERRASGVKVTILFLSGVKQLDYAVDIGLQFGIRMGSEAVGRALDGFVNIRIVEAVASVMHTLLQAAREGKVLDPAGFLALLE